MATTMSLHNHADQLRISIPLSSLAFVQQSHTPPRSSTNIDPTSTKPTDGTPPPVNPVLTPPYTPSTELSTELRERLNSILASDPFATFQCMYCCPSKSCPGGAKAKCFHSPLWEALPSADIAAFILSSREDFSHAIDIILSYDAYLAKLDQHKPYSAKGLLREREAANEAKRQLQAAADRIESVRAVVEMCESEGLTKVPLELLSEMQRCRDWIEFLWGKMIKNHECLKLNFGLTFQGKY